MKSGKKKSEKFPLVCIIIVNWNGGKVIENCMSSLNMTDYPNYKVILVDNGSKDDSVEKLKKINPKMDILYLDDNYGYTIGTNSGWEHALKKYNADYICAMDSDIVTVQKNWLSLQIKELEKKKEYGISGGKLVFPDGRFQEMVRENREHYNERDEGQYDFVKEVEAVWGACIIIKKSVIKKIGYYDESFFYGPNDIDYCIRAKKEGFKILYMGLAKIIHIGASSGLSPRRDFIYRRQSESMMIYALRHLSIKKKIGMVFRQFGRVFATRKDPFSDIAQDNLIFHKNFPKRIVLYFAALAKALKNYNLIKQPHGKVMKYH